MCLNAIKNRDLSNRFTERHFGLLLDVTLMKRDQLEFRREYAKEKVENMGLLTSTRLEKMSSKMMMIWTLINLLEQKLG